MGKSRKRKALVEKKRRDKINQILEQLIDLVPLPYPKGEVQMYMDKAGLLQVTVEYVRRLHLIRSPAWINYQNGYWDCAQEAKRYILSSGEVKYKKLVNYLNNRIQEMNVVNNVQFPSSCTCYLCLNRLNSYYVKNFQ
ncbi:hairy/enhancer-of-split related with YRPW motif protein 1-like [Centruroides vittatus]|uniref:hairy/enhancer-of-split related with YRPW motif protein 1-like n=1 Tax=Centruroides vittatus TaxID=120091 RepID=UPI003510864D